MHQFSRIYLSSRCYLSIFTCKSDDSRCSLFQAVVLLETLLSGQGEYVVLCKFSLGSHLLTACLSSLTPWTDYYISFRTQFNYSRKHCVLLAGVIACFVLLASIECSPSAILCNDFLPYVIPEIKPTSTQILVQNPI